MSWIIYRHRNKINNKSYIGKTSQKPEQRWGKNGSHYTKNPKFWPAIQKYGWDNFEHIILYTNLTKEEANLKEKEMIKYYDSYNNGYNASLGGESGFQGGHQNKNTKNKISMSVKEYLKNNPQKRSERISYLLNKNNWEKRTKSVKDYFKAGSQQAKDRVKKNKKMIICIETQQIFNSINEAAEWCGISSSGISKCLHKVQKSAGKHPDTKMPLHWKYLF